MTVMTGDLSYKTYEEAVREYSPEEKWKVFDGSPENFNLAHECIDRHMDKGTAIRIKHENGDTTLLTFSEIARLSSQFANRISNLGIKKGDRIAVILEPSIALYASIFGTLKLGGVVVVCSHLLGTEAVKYRIDNSKPSLIVIAREMRHFVGEEVGRIVITEDRLLESIENEERSWKCSTNVNDPAMIQYSSGTTGNPKPFVYNHRSIISLAPAARFAYGIRNDDRFFCPSPVGWGHFFWGGTCAPLAFGVSTGTRSGRFVPDRILEGLEEFGISNMTLSPSACRRLVTEKGYSKYRLQLRKVTYTGEPLDLVTFNSFKQIFGKELYSIYGSTEAGVVIADFAGFDDWVIKPGSLGKPMPGLTVGIIGEDEMPVVMADTGEIAVKHGEHWYRMGDMGTIDRDGYFWYKGRADDVIKSSGYRIGPEEVESVLNSHEAVLESAAIGKPDSLRGQIIKAFIKLRPGWLPGEQLELSIKEFARQKLGSHAYPREIEFIDEIPKTLEGKIKRKPLRLREMAKIQAKEP